VNWVRWIRLGYITLALAITCLNAHLTGYSIGLGTYPTAAFCAICVAVSIWYGMKPLTITHTRGDHSS